jgi:SEC-C motif-containing protein
MKKPATTTTLDAPCPCGSGQPYRACCGPWHGGPQHLQAPTAEALMRSRYSAYVLQLASYLHETWHPSTRPAEPPTFEPGVQWLGLQVKQHTVQADDRAEVLFVARSKLGGRAHRLVEHSCFVREAGRWLYLAAKAQRAEDSAGS